MGEWLDEDPELLRATLGMLAALGADAQDPPSSPDGRPDASAVTTITTTSGGARRRVINASRERRKQELQFLRDKASSLQRQLSELRDRRAALLEPHFRDAQHTQLASVVPVWENLATRQFQARRKSELRNAELKIALQAQVRIAEDLIRIIRQAAASPMAALGVPIDESKRMSEESQLLRLDMLCATWANEFEHCDKFALADSGDLSELRFLRTRVLEESLEKTELELYSCNVLPYPVARVEEIVWKIYQSEGNVEDVDEASMQTAKAKDDFLMAVFSMTSKLESGARGALRGKYVTRRIRPGGKQVVLVSQLQSAPEGFANQLDGVETFEDSWLRLVDAAELGLTQLEGPLTIVQHVRRNHIGVRVTQDDDEDSRAAPSRVEMVTQIVKKQIQQEVLWVDELLENSLVVSGDGRVDG